MKVRDAIRELFEFDQDADLVICAHEWQSNVAWHVTEFEANQGEEVNLVLIEGARPLHGEENHVRQEAQEDEGTDGAPQEGSGEQAVPGAE